MNEVKLFDRSIIYVMDAYCGWCWGFSERMKEFEKANHHRVNFSVISGGLFIGNRASKISDYPYIQQANKRISHMTGAVFGAPYQKLLDEGQMTMDSLDAATGLAALRELAPERAVHWVHELQAAFYSNGQSLSDHQTILDIAKKNGLDIHKVQTALGDGSALAAAKQDFAFARTLGVTSYPTLLFAENNKFYQLPASDTPLAILNSKLDELLA